MQSIAIRTHRLALRVTASDGRIGNTNRIVRRNRVAASSRYFAKEKEGGWAIGFDSRYETFYRFIRLFTAAFGRAPL
jgi:hypothetical protein